MLPHKTIKGRRKLFGYSANGRLFAGKIPGRRHEFLAANYQFKLDFLFKIRLTYSFYVNNVDWRKFCMER